MLKERRRGTRIQPTFRVRTEVLQEKGNIHMAVFADIVNLSENGICLQSPLKLNLRDKIVIFLPRLDQELPFVIHGAVIWVKPVGPYMFKYGVKFSGVRKTDEKKVHTELKDIMTSYFSQKSMEL